MGDLLLFKPVTLVFAIIILIESFSWAVLSFLCVLCYNDIIKYDPINMNFGLKVFTYNLYNLYLSDESFPSGTRVVIPNTFHILMWIYFLISLFLFFSTIIQLTVSNSTKISRKLKFSTIFWLTLIYLMCLYDLISCILFSLDYYYIKSSIKVESSDTEITLAVPITLLVVAAKGFILWILNFTLSIIVSVLFINAVKDGPLLKTYPEIQARNNAAYDAYGDVVIKEDPIPISNLETQNEENQSAEPHKWFTKNNSKRNRINNVRNRTLSVSSMDSFDTQPYATVNVTPSNYSGIPAARTDSYRIPRSLTASLSPSPVPPPAIDKRNIQKNKGENFNGRRNNNDFSFEFDDEDEEMNSPSYLNSAFTIPRRFNLDEPAPDYN